MKQLSLRLRSIILAVIALAIFIPVTVLTLDQAYTSSLEEAKYNELKLMNLALVSAFEIDGDSPTMPEFVYQEQLNLPDSGYMAAIVMNNEVIWQSASFLMTDNIELVSPPAVGEERFEPDHITTFDPDTKYFLYSFSAEFQSGNSYAPVHFYLLNDNATFDNERATFLSVVWQYLVGLSLLLLLLLVLGMNRVLAPVRLLINEINKTSQGEKKQLQASYPPEFSRLQQSINQLLESEAKQRERYKNSLGDLAHSLKTPLAVAMGNTALSRDAKEPLIQIDNLIQRQLKRASAGATSWESAIPVQPVINSLVGALNKVYRDKSLQISVNGEQGRFFGDKTDLMELLGNVLDNAYKAADSRVVITILQAPLFSQVTIEDDGPGIAQSQREALLTRGQRLDTYTEGQGIGMAVVADLIEIYEGQLFIDDSPSGGACISITLPNNQAT